MSNTKTILALKVRNLKTGELLILNYFADSHIAYLGGDHLYSASITIPPISNHNTDNIIQIKGIKVVDAKNHINLTFDLEVVL